LTRLFAGSFFWALQANEGVVLLNVAMIAKDYRRCNPRNKGLLKFAEIST
jgi:hypothetical protein